jgi:hypothetical protein
MLHLGVYARVARQLGVDPSAVSRAAAGFAGIRPLEATELGFPSMKRRKRPLISKVRLIPSTHNDARDEGPRLIPFGKIAERHETSDYYVRLADKILARDKKPD